MAALLDLPRADSLRDHAAARAGLPLRAAVRVAPAADTVAIAVVELVDDVVTVPVDRRLIARGEGHAVVHRLHGGGDPAH
ncbi:hypothetical protein JKP76_01985 [Blastococcus sp. TML/C7B]|uniref:hypothetical protein n=1 Tax=Blastococcus sp. TML/C7B TaxID=2798728 RepID=UPI00190C7F29|nr:hypothetical protein [Blastococcus sp. TML/C7B]MBN1094934.1 hypothetical protein [Blastococcus sp. TML/C7B]